LWWLVFAWQHACSGSDQHKDISGHKRDYSAHSPSLFPWPGSSRFFFFFVFHIGIEIKRLLIWYEYWHSRQVFQVFPKFIWMNAVLNVFSLLGKFIINLLPCALLFVFYFSLNTSLLHCVYCWDKLHDSWQLHQEIEDLLVISCCFGHLCGSNECSTPLDNI
jgi:hypothetical protein